jgi:hypothetical protein
LFQASSAIEYDRRHENNINRKGKKTILFGYAATYCIDAAKLRKKYFQFFAGIR